MYINDETSDSDKASHRNIQRTIDCVPNDRGRCGGDPNKCQQGSKRVHIPTQTKCLVEKHNQFFNGSTL